MRFWKLKLGAAIFLFSIIAHAQLSNQYPTSPSSTTLNAIPVWGDTFGGSLLDTSLLWDSTSAAGHKLTITPSLTADRTLNWPDKSGSPLVNGVSDTLTSTKISSNNTFIDSTTAAKTMTLDLSNVNTADPVVLQIPGYTGVTPGTKTVVLPSWGSGETSYTLMKTTGTLSGVTISSSRLTPWFTMDDDSSNLYPLTESAYTSGIKIVDSGENIGYINGPGKLIHVSGLIRVELDFGSTPLTEKSFTITDTNSQATDAFQGLDNFVQAQIERHTSTGKTYIDEMDMDSFFVSCTPGSGSIVCMIRCLTGQFRGTLNLDYRIGVATLN